MSCVKSTEERSGLTEADEWSLSEIISKIARDRKYRIQQVPKVMGTQAPGVLAIEKLVSSQWEHAYPSRPWHFVVKYIASFSVLLNSSGC